MYALSGLDIALWDILGKVEGPADLPAARRRAVRELPAYASLLKYNDTDWSCAPARRRWPRLPRTQDPRDRPRRDHRRRRKLLRQHNDGSLMVDVNAPWTLQEALAAVAPLRELGLKWIEEPVWPPRISMPHAQVSADRRSGRDRRECPDAIGFCAADRWPRCRLCPAERRQDRRHLDHARHLAAANAANVSVAPHSAYFGPGLIATAHLVAALSRAPMVERLYCDLTESPFGDWYEPVDGHLPFRKGRASASSPIRAFWKS